MCDNKEKSISLPQNSKLTEDAVKYLDDIFDYSSPEEYRETLIEIYQVYIISEHQSLPQEFERMASQLYFLINFFKKIGHEMGGGESEA